MSMWSSDVVERWALTTLADNGLLQWRLLITKRSTG